MGLNYYMLYYPKRAWEIVRQDGVYRLIGQARDFCRDRLVPFGFEIAMRHRLNRFRYGIVPHPLTVRWIDPLCVDQHIRTLELERRFDIGTVQGGDWDQDSVPISEWRVYQGLRQRFKDGADWEDTEYYRMGCEKIQQSGRAWNCTSPAEFLEQRCQYVDELYERIETDGYYSSAELEERKEDPGRNRTVNRRHIETHEISVAIARDGTMMVEAGIHRYCIARLLGIDEIPVQILVRHTEWQSIRNEVSESGAVPENVDPEHPDLRDLRSRD